MMDYDNNFYDLDNVPMYRDGILYINKNEVKTPLYIIQLVRLHGSSWAFVYDVDAKNARKGVPRKRRHAEQHISVKVVSNSELGNYINRDSTKEVTNVMVEDTYKYQALVIGGVSSISDKEGDGFYDRDQDGNPVDIFIGINDIEWSNEMTYDSDDLVKELLRSTEEELLSGIDGQGY